MVNSAVHLKLSFTGLAILNTASYANFLYLISQLETDINWYITNDLHFMAFS